MATGASGAVAERRGHQRGKMGDMQRVARPSRLVPP
jgi:hypothetical protein